MTLSVGADLHLESHGHYHGVKARIIYNNELFVYMITLYRGQKVYENNKIPQKNTLCTFNIWLSIPVDRVALLH